MTITETTGHVTALVFMAMSDILSLISVDAEAELEYQAEGFWHWPAGLAPLAGTTVADIIPRKLHDISSQPERYGALLDSMRLKGQTVPIAVNAGYMLNGGHRLALAILEGWPGMWATTDHEASEDREWNAQNPAYFT